VETQTVECKTIKTNCKLNDKEFLNKEDEREPDTCFYTLKEANINTEGFFINAVSCF